MKLKSFYIFLFSLGLLFTDGSRSFGQTSNLRIAFNGFGGTAPIFLGQDAGIFRKQNLNLELIFIPGGSLSLQALIGRSLELLLTGGPPVVNAHLQGAKIKIIAGMVNLLPYTFVTVGGVRSAEQRQYRRAGPDAEHGERRAPQQRPAADPGILSHETSLIFHASWHGPHLTTIDSVVKFLFRNENRGINLP